MKNIFTIFMLALLIGGASAVHFNATSMMDFSHGIPSALPMNDHKITGLANATNAQDAATLSQVQSVAGGSFLPLSGGAITGTMTVLNGTTGQQPVTYSQTLGARGYYNLVSDFGAKGDGVTDDSAAFVSAVSAPNRVIYIPSGTYEFGYHEILNILYSNIFYSQVLTSLLF